MTHPTRPRQLSSFQEFVAGGSAALVAISITHPLDVVKSRKQFVGELGAAPSSSPPPNSTLAFLRDIYRKEGIRACYRGLPFAYGLQFSVTASRFGFYNASKKFFAARLDNSFHQNFVLAAISGALGAIPGNVWYALKTRAQVYSTSSDLKFGTQHEPRGVWRSFVDVYKAEGMGGYFRGLGSFAPRVSIYGAFQLGTYDYVLRLLNESNPTLLPTAFSRQCASSVLASVASVTAIQPFDFITVRLQNQPVDPSSKRGVLYTGFFDCLNKTVAREGPVALFKGFPANVMRFGPYTVLVLVFVEQFRKVV